MSEKGEDHEEGEIPHEPTSPEFTLPEGLSFTQQMHVAISEEPSDTEGVVDTEVQFDPTADATLKFSSPEKLKEVGTSVGVAESAKDVAMEESAKEEAAHGAAVRDLPEHDFKQMITFSEFDHNLISQ
ncbi:uncharacterized protein LOC109823754 [Asparagus officinalis]|uniref:uncharacterized protein LOC109823754 n=1 Tax=Asparagus officinalis TaxID=4686 RepID=UPI00098DED6A|nr:uncharacterized protein LOC109823754 [Asparagus officinalis]